MGRKRLFGGMQVFTTGLSTTLLLILLGTTVFFVLAADNLGRRVRENLVVTVLLDDGISNKEGRTMASIIGTYDYISQSSYISKEQALKEQTEAMGLDSTEFASINPFTASIELHLTATYACNDSIIKITRELKKMDHVTNVLCQRDLVESITTTLQRMGYAMLALAALFTIISFTLINNTVKLSIYSRRHIINTMRLVGASWSFIRRPFILSSMWLGLVSGLVSTALIVGAANAVIHLDTTLQQYVPQSSLFIVGGVVTASGLLLTVISSFISVSSYLRMPMKDMH